MHSTKHRERRTDDHPIVRLGIRQMISAEHDLEVCGEADSTETSLELAAELKPQLAVVDLSLGHGTGVDVIRALQVAVPGLPVLVLSMHDEELYAESVLRAGARGYIMKREAITHLVAAIRTALSGRIYVSEAMASAITPVPSDGESRDE
jgi:DNA-binding NarL/FixJ family response regulator